MSFKDTIQNDLSTFIGNNEFAELHNVDGLNIPVMIDEDNTHERSRQPMDLYNTANGVYVGSITIYVRLSDLGYRPVIEQHLRLDDELRLVKSCSDDMGMLKIGLEANEA